MSKTTRHEVTPYLTVTDSAAALAFYAKAFGATETMRMAMPDGRIGHAEFKIGEAGFMVADEFPEMKIVGPQTLNGTTVLMHLYVPDVDALSARAIAAGATAERPVEDQFYGDRSGTLIDPFGHRWMISTHMEDVSPEEMARRMKSMQPS